MASPVTNCQQNSQLMLFCQYRLKVSERCFAGPVPRRTLAALKNKRSVSKDVIEHLGRRKAVCALLASCSCVCITLRLSGGRIRQGVIYVQLSLAAVSIFPTCCNLSILPPPSTRRAVRRIISRRSLAGGLETEQTLTLLGPPNCGRCCHSERRDPSLHTAGEK